MSNTPLKTKGLKTGGAKSARRKEHSRNASPFGSAVSYDNRYEF